MQNRNGFQTEPGNEYVYIKINIYRLADFCACRFRRTLSIWDSVSAEWKMSIIGSFRFMIIESPPRRLPWYHRVILLPRYWVYTFFPCRGIVCLLGDQACVLHRLMASVAGNGRWAVSIVQMIAAMLPKNITMSNEFGYMEHNGFQSFNGGAGDKRFW